MVAMLFFMFVTGTSIQAMEDELSLLSTLKENTVSMKNFSAIFHSEIPSSSSTGLVDILYSYIPFLWGNDTGSSVQDKKIGNNYCKVNSALWKDKRLVHFAFTVSFNKKFCEIFYPQFNKEDFCEKENEKKYFNFVLLSEFFKKMSITSFDQGAVTIDSDTFVRIPVLYCKENFALLGTLFGDKEQNRLEWTDEPCFTAEDVKALRDNGILKIIPMLEDSDQDTPTSHVFEVEDGGKSDNKIVILLNWKNVSDHPQISRIIRLLQSTDTMLNSVTE